MPCRKMEQKKIGEVLSGFVRLHGSYRIAAELNFLPVVTRGSRKLIAELVAYDEIKRFSCRKDTFDSSRS